MILQNIIKAILNIIVGTHKVRVCELDLIHYVATVVYLLKIA